jgi:hypothetical protein
MTSPANVEGGEGEVEIMLGRLAGVDGAAHSIIKAGAW